MKWRRTKKCCRIIWWCDVWNFLLVHLFFPICHWPVKSPPLCRKTKKKQWSLGPSIFIFGMTDYVNVYSSLLHPSRYIYPNVCLLGQWCLHLTKRTGVPTYQLFDPTFFFRYPPFHTFFPTLLPGRFQRTFSWWSCIKSAMGWRVKWLVNFFSPHFKKKHEASSWFNLCFWWHPSTHYNMSYLVESEAPFNLEVKAPLSSVPEAVMKRCWGKQAPIAPHRQRLLIAGCKEATLEDAKKQDKPVKPKAPAKPKKVKQDKQVPPKPSGEAASKNKTPYAEAKTIFINKFLDQIGCFLVG